MPGGYHGHSGVDEPHPCVAQTVQYLYNTHSDLRHIWPCIVIFLKSQGKR